MLVINWSINVCLKLAIKKRFHGQLFRTSEYNQASKQAKKKSTVNLDATLNFQLLIKQIKCKYKAFSRKVLCNWPQR